MKNLELSFLVSVILVTLLSSFEVHGQVIPDQGLIAKFDFDNSVIDSANLKTSTKYGCSFTHGICRDSSGSIYFDGNNDYLSFGKFDSLGLHLDSFTIAFWISSKACSENDWQSPIRTINNASAGQLIGIDIFRGDGSTLRDDAALIQIRDDADKYLTMKIHNIDLFDGSWRHLVFVVENSSLNMGKIYVDGIEQKLISGITNSGPSKFVGFDNDFVIGAANLRGTISNFFEGKLDQLLFYNRPLDSNEILSIFNSACINRKTFSDTLYVTDTVQILDTIFSIEFDTFYDIINVYDTSILHVYDTVQVIRYDTIEYEYLDTVQINVFDTLSIVKYHFDTVKITLYDTSLIVERVTVSDTNMVTLIHDSCGQLIVEIDDGCYIKIFPNPARSNLLTISDICLNQSWDKLELINDIGQIVSYENEIYSHDFELNLNRYPRGVYFLNLYKGGFLVLSTKVMLIR